MTGKTILQGLVGSRAYGLAKEDSDYDQAGVYLAPTRTVLGLGGAEAVNHTIQRHEPDLALHELGKFCSLAIKGNPTISELLWLPSYETLTEEAQLLVALRRAFLGAKSVRAAYTGYAIQQAKRLMNRHADGKEGFDPDVAKRTAKHGRHCRRLILQAHHLLATGELIVDVSQWREEIFSFGELAEVDPQGFYGAFQNLVARLDDLEPVIPERAHEGIVNAAVVTIRELSGDPPGENGIFAEFAKRAIDLGVQAHEIQPFLAEFF